MGEVLYLLLRSSHGKVVDCHLDFDVNAAERLSPLYRMLVVVVVVRAAVRRLVVVIACICRDYLMRVLVVHCSDVNDRFSRLSI